MANMDPRAADTPSSLVKRLGWLVFALLACGHFSLLYLWRSPQFLNLPLYARGGERLPYQGRILMAWVLHVTAGSPRLGPLLARAAGFLPVELRDPYLLVMLLTTFTAMFVAILAARASLLHLTGDRQFASWAALLTLYMAYFNLAAVYGLTYILPYDVPSLAFFSLGVWLVLTRLHWLLLPVFVLGTLNRETFCFLTIFFALYSWFTPQETTSPADRSRALRKTAPHLALQAALWLALRLWVNHHFAANAQERLHGGGLFAVQLTQNLRSLAKPPQWPLLLSLFGFTLPLFFSGYRWITDRALARSVAVLLPLWATAMLIVGVIVEIRVFNELTAFLVPAIGLIAWNRWFDPALRRTVEPARS